MTNSFQLVSIFISGFDNLNRFVNQPAEYEKQKSMLNITFDRFQINLDLRIAGQKTKEKLKLLVQNTLLKLSALSNNFDRFYQTNLVWIEEYLIDFKGLFLNVESRIFEIFEYLRRSFTDCFNSNLEIPVAFFSLIDLESEPMYQLAFKNKNIDQELLGIIEDYLNCISNPGRHEVKTWSQFEYFKRIKRALKYFSGLPATENDTLELIKILVKKNFNADSFYDFMLGYENKLVEVDGTFEEGDEQLYQLWTAIGRIRPIINLSYNVEIGPIQKSICKSISANRKRNAELNVILLGNVLNGKSGKTSDYYFEYNRPLIEVMFLFRLLINMGIVKTKSMAAIYNFIGRHIKVDKTKSPSQGYLRNLNVNDADVPHALVKKVRELLLKIVAYIDLNFKDQVKF